MARMSAPHDRDAGVGGWIVTGGERASDGTWRITLTAPDGSTRHAEAIADGHDVWTLIDGVVRVVSRAPAEGPRRRARAAHGSGLEAPMPATVTRVVVQVGQTVAPGDVLILLEAMKMELAVKAPHAGTVTRIACEPGALVQPGIPLVELS
jgi:3-methylcrotonyl-CoA carboxylase alpha subunit